MNKKPGTGMIYTGLLFLTVALCLLLHNIYWNAHAEKTVLEAVSILETLAPPADAAEIRPEIIREMPEVEINGQNYIGTLQIPSLELTLGIISHWDMQRLQISPCRYTGSVYTGDLVIAAHNYNAHFGRIRELQRGDTVLFTDTEGNTTAYDVVLQQILMPEDVEEMTDGQWDLTLFTCTLGGKSRITIRCQMRA